MKHRIKEFVEAVIGCALIAGMVAAYCIVTPNQLSGESDWSAVAEMEVAE